MRGKLSLVGVVMMAAVLAGAMPGPAAAAAPAIADNSASDAAPNVLPGDGNTPTGAASDIEDARVTAAIHGALAADKSLSELAHHVSISTNAQAVVLRGSVQPGEKDRVEAVASQLAGTRQVVDQLLVKDL
ncbi:MAG TPA: BON domain-containing protein [Steroidobacteraceae bacterium]